MKELKNFHRLIGCLQGKPNFGAKIIFITRILKARITRIPLSTRIDWSRESVCD